MLHSFPNIRIGLLVGIGGRAPSEKHDIRLGDVVVSAPRDGLGGVFQYDFGKSIHGSFQHTRFLNQPPTYLRTAMTGIQAQYKRKGHRLQEDINNILKNNPRLRREYERPQPYTDMLFKPGHLHDSRGCAKFCADSLNLISRSERAKYEDNPAIHYGLIASANQLMKDALIRDRLAAEKDVLCFEIEAAGLVNHFPCLIIRDICDYSDSHKNKEWQGYASMVAAAYAKDLVRRIPPNKVEAEKRIGHILSDLQAVAEEHRDIAQKQLELHETTVKHQWSEKQDECLQLFSLATGTNDATYDWYKDHVGVRVDGTCEWFLNHENYQTWLKQNSGLLLISADPGCGKSVLARYLIDDILPPSSTTCYFFFKDQDQNTVNQALCALLHQLFSQRPPLIECAMEYFRKDGPNLVKSTNSLWNILNRAVQDPQAGPIIIVLDALDECTEIELIGLIRGTKSQFQSGQSTLKYLFTSRPYEQIMGQFRGQLDSFHYVLIPGENESENISREINHVIRYQVEQLAKEKRLSDSVKSHLAKRLLEVPPRTYLWIYLVFDFLATEHFKKTPSGVDATFASLPTNIYEAYERIISKSKKDPMVRKTLSIILAASRPLSLEEVNIALNIDGSVKLFEDLDLEQEEDFRSRIRTWCGLFVSIHQDKIDFLHQTAREFLLAHEASPTTSALPSDLPWQHSITSQQAHSVLAEVCVFYLDILNDKEIPSDGGKNGFNLDIYAFLEYSAMNWSTHYRKACISPSADLLSSTLSICNPASSSCLAWFEIYWRNNARYTSTTDKMSPMTSSYLGPEAVVIDARRGTPGNMTSPIISFYLGLEAVVKALLKKGVDTESKDQRYGRTPLAWAVYGGHYGITRLLVESGADIESTDNSLATPLSCATRNGLNTIVKLLLERGARFDLEYGGYYYTPLSLAAKRGRETVVRVLLERGAKPDLMDVNGRKPLVRAVQNGRDAIVKLLLEKGADIKFSDYDGRTLLSWAASRGHGTTVKLLLEKGADFELRDHDGQTPLSWAAAKGHESSIKILLERGADPKSTNWSAQTPPSWHGLKRNETIIKLLLEGGADPKSIDDHGQTVLENAAGLNMSEEENEEFDDEEPWFLLSDRQFVKHRINSNSYS